MFLHLQPATSLCLPKIGQSTNPAQLVSRKKTDTRPCPHPWSSRNMLSMHPRSFRGNSLIHPNKFLLARNPKNSFILVLSKSFWLLLKYWYRLALPFCTDFLEWALYYHIQYGIKRYYISTTLAKTNLCIYPSIQNTHLIIAYREKGGQHLRKISAVWINPSPEWSSCLKTYLTTSSRLPVIGGVRRW